MNYGPSGGVIVFVVQWIIEPVWNLVVAVWKHIGFSFEDLSEFLSKVSVDIANGFRITQTKLGKFAERLSLNGATLFTFLFWTADLSLIGLLTGINRGTLFGFVCGLIIACLHMLCFGHNLWPTINGVYLLGVTIFGHLYRQFLVYQYPEFRRPPETSRNRFTFGLMDGFLCDPDWRIFAAALFCTPVRWADTASAARVDMGRVHEANFWFKMIGFATLTSLVSYTYGLSIIALLAWTVHVRQKIRKAYGLPEGENYTIAEDTIVWLACAPCATMQEALQCEFVNPVTPVAGPPSMGPGPSNGSAVPTRRLRDRYGMDDPRSVL